MTAGRPQGRTAVVTMDLYGAGGEQHFTHMGWSKLLELAVQHGWRPLGTVDPQKEEAAPVEGEDDPSGDVEVPMSYFLNDGLLVRPEDARALADALERALPDVPDHDALEHKTFTHPAEPGVRLIDANTPVNPFEWFSGKKDRLREFIAFCRKGGFEIR
jgi:hypothetical protein